MVFNLLSEIAKQSERSLTASTGWLFGVCACAVTPTIINGGSYATALISGQRLVENKSTHKKPVL